MDNEVDTTNYHMVAVGPNGSIVVLNPPIGPMTKSEALAYAAWIVALADPLDQEFKKTLNAVLNT